jgi:hypothetical protein
MQKDRIEGVALPNTKEFAITFTSDWTWDIVHELGDYLGIRIDDGALEAALDEEDPKSNQNMVKFYDSNNKKNLMVVCCFDNDTFHHIVLRCDSDCADKYKSKLLEVDNKMRKSAMQRIRDDLTDLSNNAEYGLSRLEKDYDIQFP